MNITNSNLVITGASSGIGQELLSLLLDAGARVSGGRVSGGRGTDTDNTCQSTPSPQTLLVSAGAFARKQAGYTVKDGAVLISPGQ